MTGALFIFLGGGLGAILRHYMTLLSHRILGMNYPYGTFIINILGSLFLGFIATWALNKVDFDPNLKLFLTVGIAGGFTTFSTFSYETMTMIKSGQVLASLVYMILSFSVGLAAVYLGAGLAKNF